ncbi:hypothetical protein LCGC14_1388620 [marine sediment metagenome]|uniref:Uncharacterized protein n=1 Tax=marine sediment metagenome TaxID=412755 RepID=A0A0F9K0N1_9ZZZZ
MGGVKSAITFVRVSKKIGELAAIGAVLTLGGGLGVLALRKIFGFSGISR